MEGYKEFVQDGLETLTWGTDTHKFINILQTVKSKLKIQNKTRLKTNLVQQLKEEYNKAFLQLDENPKDMEQYNKLL